MEIASFLTRLSKIATLEEQREFSRRRAIGCSQEETEIHKGDPVPLSTKTPLATLIECWEKSPVKKVYDEQSEQFVNAFGHHWHN